METKKDIRTLALTRRSSLSETEWNKKSSIICEKAIAHALFQNTSTVLCYVDYRGEVGTRKFIQACWDMGKKVAVPKVLGEEMEFYFIHSFADLEEGYRGILEPKETTIACVKNGLVIMPGAAFDKQHSRIGYGTGYYDKYLHRHSKLDTMAFAFTCQMFESIPSDAHDVKPAIIITEDEIYESKHSK